MIHNTTRFQFLKAFSVARRTCTRVATATCTTAELATATATSVNPDADHQYFLTGDHQSGFVVKDDGELVAVFSLVRGRGDALISAAVSAGASHLDCFDGFLPTRYAAHGFVETHRVANWTPGEPDVVFMKNNP